MDKDSVVDFFNKLAPQWDAEMIRDDRKISLILDYAGVKQGVQVLDVACGTGVLISDYLSRKVAGITGIDISPAMIEIAKSKFNDPRVKFICDDVENAELPANYDCCVIYNAFPHFPQPEHLIQCLSTKLKADGRLTVAHGMSRAMIDHHHSGAASKVSMGLMNEECLAELFAQYYTVDVKISNDQMYVVSGVKK